jgi:hypothetical protein
MKPLASFNRRILPIMWVLLIGCLAGCNLPAPKAISPTLDVTQAYRTVEARLTEASRQTTPSPAPFTASPIPAQASATSVSVPSETPAQALIATSIVSACDRAEGGADIDVTIPDDTVMMPGEAFTKVWRLTNVGSCTWTLDYALVWFSGELLSAPKSIPLAGNVAPGQTADLFVDMVAPTANGTYQSNWKLRNAAGVLFGIGPNGESSFWVRIVVKNAPTSTITPSLTSTSAPTATGTASPTTTLTPSITPTPGPLVNGPAQIRPGEAYDLDSNRATPDGADLEYSNADQGAVLDPINGAALALFGGSTPSQAECQNITLSADPLALSGLSAGSFLCYRTNQGHTGWAQFVSLAEDGALNLEIYTWATP